MKYVKQAGSVWDTYYAIDDENLCVSAVEARYTGPDKTYIETYLITNYSASRGTYDGIARDSLKELETITQKEWNEAKKDSQAFIKYLEDKYQ
jgi:hypothetical protein